MFSLKVRNSRRKKIIGFLGLLRTPLILGFRFFVGSFLPFLLLINSKKENSRFQNSSCNRITKSSLIGIICKNPIPRHSSLYELFFESRLMIKGANSNQITSPRNNIETISRATLALF